MLQISTLLWVTKSFTCLVLYIASFVSYICLEPGAFSEIASQSSLYPVWQGRGRAFSLLQVQSGGEIAGDGEAEGTILKKIFDAVLCWKDLAVCLPSSWWLRQQWARFLELSSPGEAQQIGWLDFAHSPSSWERGFTDMSAAIKQRSCLWY